MGNDETGGSIAAPIFHSYMEVALRDRPVIQFPQPPGVTMAAWEGSTDAFKPDQPPGGSGPIITGLGMGPMSDVPMGGGTVHGGVDSNLPGVY